MKKIILTEADKKQIVSAKEKAILESFAKTFNKIKRLDENELNEYDLEKIKKQLADTGYPADDEELSNIQGAIDMGKNKPTNKESLDENGYKPIVIGDVVEFNGKTYKITSEYSGRVADGNPHDGWAPIEKYGLEDVDTGEKANINKHDEDDRIGLLTYLRQNPDKIKRMSGDDDMLEEGWKDWVLGGLLTLSTLGGGVKLYQLDQEKQQDQQAQKEYYTKVLEPVVAKSGDLSGLGAQINNATNAMNWNEKMTPQDINAACQNYAEKYMQVNAKEFGVGTDGKIYWIPALNKGMQTN